ncbi:MAG: hypothetical protein IOD12_10400 [Silvanigrellales bacterium]|nr:hypothetical protein [Silvanigrellales bacterium]
MRRRLSAWSRVFLVTVGTSFAGLVASVVVVEKFPWQTVNTDFSLARVSQFLTPWPMSAMDEEQQERKRLRRFAKQEVERRFGIQLRRMESLHTPLFDPFLDAGVQIVHSTDATAPQPNLHFPWPGLETIRVSGEPGLSKKVTYFAAASPHGVQLVEGVAIGASEEIRLTFPIIRNRRTLDFVALPLSPGTVRGTLGQYSWVRNFADSDIHRFQTISIPLNDSTASSLRITSQSSHFLLLGAAVSQWDKSGRLPVQIANKSGLWKENPDLVRKLSASAAEGISAEGEAEKEKVDLAAPADPKETDSSPSAGGATAAGAGSAVGAEGLDDDASDETSDEGTGGGTKNASQEAIKDASKDVQSRLIDPMEETANGQVVTQSDRTAALGYNILLLQTGEIPEALVSNLKALATLAPNLAELLGASVRTQASAVAQESARDVFHRTVLAAGTAEVATNNPLLLKKYLEDSSRFNLYARLRNFGYKVVALAPAPFLGFSEDLANGRDVPLLERRWLGSLDWPFAQRNKELDEQSQPVTGLDAIFQTNTSPLSPPLTDADLVKIGAFLGVIGKAQETFPDWRVNEMFLPDTQGLYLPASVDFIQRWSKDNTQARFFLHAYLDTRVGQTRASMKDLFQVAKSKKFVGLASSDEAEVLARLVLLDRAIGQIISTLKARKVTHRTLVGLVLPHERRGGESRMTTSLLIPGVLPKAGPLPVTFPANVDDLVATAVTTVGIPLGRNLADSVTPFPGLSWEHVRGKGNKEASESRPGEGGDEGLLSLKRYVVYLRSGNTGCSPISWVTDEDVFGFESSHPVIEFPAKSDRQHFEIFPCSLPGTLVRLSWFQRRTALLSSSESVMGAAGASAAPMSTQNGTGNAAGGAIATTPLSPRAEALAARVRERERERLRDERLRDGMSLATLRGYFALGALDGSANETERTSGLPLFFFGRNALRLGALPMTLSALTEKEVSRVFDVEEDEVPDKRLARDILDLSEFNEGVDRRGAFGGVGSPEQMRSAFLVFRHSVRPEGRDILKTAGNAR